MKILEILSSSVELVSYSTGSKFLRNSCQSAVKALKSLSNFCIPLVKLCRAWKFLLSNSKEFAKACYAHAGVTPTPPYIHAHARTFRRVLKCQAGFGRCGGILPFLERLDCGLIDTIKTYIVLNKEKKNIHPNRISSD